MAPTEPSEFDRGPVGPILELQSSQHQDGDDAADGFIWYDLLPGGGAVPQHPSATRRAYGMREAAER